MAAPVILGIARALIGRAASAAAARGTAAQASAIAARRAAIAPVQQAATATGGGGGAGGAGQGIFAKLRAAAGDIANAARQRASTSAAPQSGQAASAGVKPQGGAVQSAAAGGRGGQGAGAGQPATASGGSAGAGGGKPATGAATPGGTPPRPQGAGSAPQSGPRKLLGDLRTQVSEKIDATIKGTFGPSPAEKSPASASKPKIDYGSMIANMHNPNAADDARAAAEQQQKQAEAEEEAARPGELRKTFKALTFLAGPFGKMASVVMGSLFGLKKWTDALVESRRHLGKWSGSIAASTTQLDIQKLQMEMRLARNTTGSTVQLNKAIGEFREVMFPIENDLRTMINVLATAAVKTGSAMAFGVLIAKHTSGIPQILQLLRWLGNENQERADQQTNAAKVINQLAGRNPGPARPPLPPIKRP